jgi:hypothetical protein
MKTWIGALCLMFLAGCNETVDGNGHLVEEFREVRDFRGLRVENGLDVQVELGSEPSLRLWLDENLLEYVVTSVEGGDLVLRTKEDVSLDPSGGAQIYVRAPLIEFVDLEDGSDLEGEVGGDEEGYVSLEASGGSDLDLTVYAAGVDAEASGGSDIDLSGSARELFVDASGGSAVDSALATENLQVDASGGSDVSASASQSATVEASGGSDVTVYGAPPERHVDTSGGSDVAFR